MKRIIICIMYFSIVLFLFSCKTEKKPFGATDYSYDKVEGINKDGPVLSDNIPENIPPIGDKVLVEKGPWHIDDPKLTSPPTGDIDPDFVDDSAPIYEPEHKD